MLAVARLAPGLAAAGVVPLAESGSAGGEGCVAGWRGVPAGGWTEAAVIAATAASFLSLAVREVQSRRRAPLVLVAREQASEEGSSAGEAGLGSSVRRVLGM